MEAWKRGRRLLGYLSCGDGGGDPAGRLAGGVGERRNVGSLRGENKESGKGRGGKEEKIVD